MTLAIYAKSTRIEKTDLGPPVRENGLDKGLQSAGSDALVSIIQPTRYNILIHNEIRHYSGICRLFSRHGVTFRIIQRDTALFPNKSIIQPMSAEHQYFSNVCMANPHGSDYSADTRNSNDQKRLVAAARFSVDDQTERAHYQDCRFILAGRDERTCRAMSRRLRDCYWAPGRCTGGSGWPTRSRRVRASAIRQEVVLTRFGVT